MTVKIVQGFVGSNTGYQEIKVGVSSKTVQSSQALSSTALQQTIASAAGNRTLSDAVVNTVRSGRATSGTSEKIREYREAREVSQEVAEKIRDGEPGFEAHDGIDGRVPLAN